MGGGEGRYEGLVADGGDDGKGNAVRTHTRSKAPARDSGSWQRGRGEEKTLATTAIDAVCSAGGRAYLRRQTQGGLA